jgi:hypothetical protein
MPKYRASIERKVIKTLILNYEFDTEDDFKTVKKAIQNGEIDSYESPIDEDYMEENCKDSLLILEDLESEEYTDYLSEK